MKRVQIFFLILNSHKILFFSLKVKLWNELYLVFCFLLPFLLGKTKKRWKFLNVIRTVQSDSCMIKYDFQDLYPIFSYLILCTMEWKYVWGSICILLILAISWSSFQDADLFTKGQLILKGLFKVFIHTKKLTKVFLYFCPSL